MFGFYNDHFVLFGLNVSYYGLIIACAMIFGVWLACNNAKARKIKTNDLIIAACYIFPLAIVGARVYYFIFNRGAFGDFWEIFQIWKGGLAIYGAILGGALGLGLYCLIHKKNFFDFADVIVPSIIIGQAVGRVGCIFAGCCYGNEITDPNLNWFPIAFEGRYATRFYEIFWDAGTFIVLMLMLRKFKFRQRGSVAAWYLILYGTGRAWIEALRGDSLYIGPIKVSQLLSIILVVIGIVLLTFYYAWNEKKKEEASKEQTEQIEPSSAQTINSEKQD